MIFEACGVRQGMRGCCLRAGHDGAHRFGDVHVVDYAPPGWTCDCPWLLGRRVQPGDVTACARCGVRRPGVPAEVLKG